jgi:hypothetical protein
MYRAVILLLLLLFVTGVVWFGVDAFQRRSTIENVVSRFRFLKNLGT